MLTKPKKEIVVVDCTPTKYKGRGFQSQKAVDVLGTSNSLYIHTNFRDPCSLDVKLSNYYSKVLVKEHLKNVSIMEIPLDLSQESEGVYVLKISVDGQVHTEKMVIKIDR